MITDSFFLACAPGCVGIFILAFIPSFIWLVFFWLQDKHRESKGIIMRIFFTETAKRDLARQKIPLETALTAMLQPEEKVVRDGSIRATRRLAVECAEHVVSVTYKQYPEFQNVLCISKRRLE